MAQANEVSLLKPANKPESANENSKMVELQDRRTPELVIALVGPVGSGVSYTAALTASILKDEFDYRAVSYKVSSIIKDACGLIGETFDTTLEGNARIERLQTLGNKLRAKFGADYLSGKVIERIAAERVDNDGYEAGGDTVRPPKPRRVVHIIDSLKNPAEVRHLRDVYGDTFWLVGVFAPEGIRKERLKEQKGIRDRDVQGLVERDEDEGVADGQKVRDTIYEADFFLRNDGVNDERARRSLQRFFDVLFNVGVATPTVDEAAMYTAVSSAASSACLSRQVGAAIYSPQNELIGVGSNDVPKFGGGIYHTEDGDSDNRCFKYGGKFCHNDQRKERLYEHIWTELIEAKVIDKKKQKYDDVRTALAKTEIRSLIEYSRAVHAEMEAIISVARGNKPGLQGATLYCTTFPCHSCARHIIAAGVRKVIYIEPYPKSLAIDLHKDAASMDEKDADKKVVFLQYDGIAPKNIVRFFKHGLPRKDKGKSITRSPKEAYPVLQPLLDGYTTREQIVVSKLVKIESANQ